MFIGEQGKQVGVVVSGRGRAATQRFSRYCATWRKRAALTSKSGIDSVKFSLQSKFIDDDLPSVAFPHLGFTENDVGIRGRGFEDVWFGDDEENVFGLPDGDSVDAEDGLETQFAHRFSRLLLRT